MKLKSCFITVKIFQKKQERFEEYTHIIQLTLKDCILQAERLVIFQQVEAFKKSNIYFIGHRSIYYFAIGVLLTLPMKYILLFAYIAITP